MTNEALRAVVLHALGELPVSSRAMFGGYGLYLDGVFFGVIFDGKLYFRTDDASRGDYVERGMPPLQPRYRTRGPKTVDRNFQVPAEVLGDAGVLCAWALRAAQAGASTRVKKPSAKRTNP